MIGRGRGARGSARWIGWLAAGAVVLSLAACGKTSSDSKVTQMLAVNVHTATGDPAPGSQGRDLDPGHGSAVLAAVKAMAGPRRARPMDVRSVPDPVRVRVSHPELGRGRGGERVAGQGSAVEHRARRGDDHAAGAVGSMLRSGIAWAPAPPEGAGVFLWLVVRNCLWPGSSMGPGHGFEPRGLPPAVLPAALVSKPLPGSALEIPKGRLLLPQGRAAAHPTVHLRLLWWLLQLAVLSRFLLAEAT